MTTFDAGTQRLIDDLLEKPQSFTRDELIAKVKRGWYHDFKSPFATPEGVLVKHLTIAGFEDLAERVLDDRYSQNGTGESDKWAEETEEGRQSAERMQDPQMQAAMNAILQRAADPAYAAKARAFMLDCIRRRDFRHRVFNDAKVKDQRKAN